MKKHLEIKTYTFFDINVMVAINYDRNEISLIERTNTNNKYNLQDPFEAKKWVFSNRKLEFMNSWLNILSAMSYAVDEAKKELHEYNEKVKKEKNDMVEAVLTEATEIVKKKSNDNKKKKY